MNINIVSPLLIHKKEQWRLKYASALSVSIKRLF